MEPTKSHALMDLTARALEAGKPDLIQVWFERSVLDRYREEPDSKILRSDSAGRLRGSGGWLVNFGIAPGDEFIHLSLGSLATIPEGHRAHWLEHLVALPVGENFLRMTVNPAACIEDGDSRPW